MYWPAEPQVWKGHGHPSTPAISIVVCRTQATSALMQHVQPSTQAGSNLAGLRRREGQKCSQPAPGPRPCCCCWCFCCCCLFATSSCPTVEKRNHFHGGDLHPMAASHVRPSATGDGRNHQRRGYPKDTSPLPAVPVHGYPHTHDGAINKHNSTTHMAKREGHENTPTRA